METKQALEKWLNNEATPADMQVLNAWPDFDSYKKIDAHTKRMVLPEHDITSGIKALRDTLLFNKAQKQKRPKVVTMPMLLILQKNRYPYKTYGIA